MKAQTPLSRHTASRYRHLAVLSLGALCGCASVVVDPQAVDQFLPEQAANGASCRELNAPGSNGKSCRFIVQPGVRYDQQGNRTGIHVKPDERYRITLPDKQFWYDLDRRVPAPDGDSGGGITKCMGFTKHHTELKWFALMATVKPLGPRSAFPGDPHAKAISTGKDVFCPAVEGELSFYVNDAAWFYDNNSGRILVVIERLPDCPGCSNAAAEQQCNSQTTPGASPR
ncbi:MAG: hypothetical protein PHD19_11995 [Dechloromonas sp.]|nr:hypothetical protein [Dechloromonas sp.]